MRFYLLFALIVIFINGNAPSSAVPSTRPAAVASDDPPAPPPEPPLTGPTAEESAAAKAARELVNASTWGVVSSIANNLDKAPFGNALSYSDGGTGAPFFYLTPLDNATVIYSRVDSKTSLTVSQYALGTCGDFDPEEPVCAKVTLTGELKKVTPGTGEAEFANATLFDSHPRFKDVPKGGMFEIYKLMVKNIYLINSYVGSPKYPSKEAYFEVEL